MSNQLPSNQLRHECAVQLFDGIECDLDEHKGMGCTCCTPYIHADLTMDHEPSCTAIKVTIETTHD